MPAAPLAPIIRGMLPVQTLAALPPIVADHLSWWIAGAVVVLGLLIYGFGDVRRFSLRRAWAISGVCFDESIRRKVLWITPLAILGAVIVTQLQRPLDAQDAIRQTIKFCLFTTGLLVTVTAIILACTNLPKEIETRVIYTIVTKPTTRLEIVVGKVLGFARVSAAILLIMGVFTFAYLHVRAWTLRREVVAQLNSGDYEALSKPTLEYYRDAGLLAARSFLRPADVQIFSRVPDPSQGKLWMLGGDGDLSFVVPFELTVEDLIPRGVPGAPPGVMGMYVRLNIGFEPHAAAKQRVADATTGPTTLPSDAYVHVEFLDETFSTVMSEQINRNEPIRLTDPTGRTPILVEVGPEAASSLIAPGTAATRLLVQVSGLSPQMEYFVSSDTSISPVSLIVPGVKLVNGQPVPDMSDPDNRTVIQPLRDPNNPELFSGPIFRGRIGTYGQQLRGGKPEESPLAVYSFFHRRGDPTVRAVNGRVPFEIKVGLERSGAEEDALTQMQIQVTNRTTGKSSGPIDIYPENVRTSFFTVPADAVGDGNFDVYIRNFTQGNYLGLLSTSIATVASEHSFDFNLIKSLLIRWLMALLVVIIAIFSSTFLSWPIAIVLTIVILIGHWAVLQLGEDVGPGLGARIATEMGFDDAGRMRAVARSVDALSKLLTSIAAFLPDISKFASVEDIERGISISADRLADPLLVLLTFGLPMLVLAYVILRNKEVAP